MNRKRREKRREIGSKSLKILFASSMGLAAFSGIVVSSSINSEAKGQSTATATNTALVNGVEVTLNQNLVDNNDGTYTMSLNTSSSLRYSDKSLKNTSAKYGFFKANTTGDYLFEIWGGDGGTGENTRYSNGGKGGEGAHLYASLNMKAGEYIFYTIGGDGEQTVSTSTGGGANGDGGDHGDTGSYYVGGGGGFTALYYFDSNSKTHFEETYLENGELIRTDVTENDRVNKYIMIAGGGGGGGAGNAFSLSNKAIRTADGGNAGGFNSPSGVLSGSAYKVEGTFYSGSDGYSSGKNQDYIGKGGSNVPGEVNTTFFEWFNGKQPNDWEGASNPSYPGGSGGAGNLRGGAGGAGYAGGSGGIMAGLLLGYDVGGGGGGSSFVSNKLNTALTPNEQVFVTNYNESTTGGAVYITHVPDESAYTCLDDLTINGEISEYFDIVGISSTKGTASLNGNKFTVTNATSVPGTSITTSTETLLTMKIKPKAELMGGNDVPVFADNAIKYDYVKDSTPGTFNIGLKDSTSYVNLPYKFELVTNNYTGVCPDGGAYTEKKAKDLFEDNDYISKKSTKGYAFINDVTDYTIKDEDGHTYAKNDTISITSTKKFYISFTVTPKTGSKAIVGDRLVEKTYTKEAKISIITTSKNMLNGNEMSYTKTLNYDSSSNSYALSVHVSTSGIELADSAEFPYSSQGTGSYTVTTAGVYGLHAWGGNGGLGGDGSNDEAGMAGGSGGYYETKIYLEVGDVVTYSVGKNGDKGKASSSWLNCGGQGTGGIRSEVYVNGTKMIVAGGGGGGGGGTVKSGQSTGDSCTELGDGTDGSPATSSPGSNSHKGGSAGTNYVNTAAIDAKNQGHDISDSYRYTPDSYSATGKNGGAVYISPLAKNKTLSNYGVKADFTSDFNLTKVEITGATATKSDTNPNVTNIIPNDVVIGNTRYVDFTVKYTLNPNCIGGNDIKLLNALELNQVDCNGSTLDDKIDVAALDSTDYANVKIDSSVLNKFTLNTYNVDYLQGGDGVAISSLADGSTTFTPTEKVEIVPYEQSFPATEGKVNPDITTEYVVNYGVRPTAAPTKAVVGPAVSEQVITGVSTVTVYHTINFDTSHMKIEAEKKNIGGDDVFVYVPGQDYEAKLTPEAGWDKPDDVTLTIDGVEHPEYLTINDDGTILISIPGSELTPTSDIQFTSNAKEKEYKIHYLVSLDATGILTKDYTVKAKAGDDISTKIDDLIAEYPPEGAPGIAGYTFTVEYPDGVKPTTMGAADLWINGVYNPNPHTLTVHYVDMDGNPIAPDYVDPNTSCYYHKQYSLTPAEVINYAPNYVKVGSKTAPISDLNAANPQFSMPDQDLDIYIYYVAVTGKAVINYVCQDDIESLPNTVIIDDKAPGENYSVDSPIIPGYVASIATVSGQIKAEGEAITVTYVPVSHTISFNSDGGTEFDDRTVFYGHEVGYTGDSYAEATFEPLPTPVKVGYNFLGWYLNNTKIDASTIWELDGDFTLKAKWEKKSYSVTIRYSYDDNSGVVTPLKNVVLTGLYGDTYTYTHQNIEGYTAPAMTSGNYIASNINIDVTYTINYHDIIVHYVDDNGATLKADEVISNQKYASDYEVNSTFTDDKYKAISPEQYTGTMPDNNLELTFEYELKTTPVTEDNSEVTITPKYGTEFVYGKDNTPNVEVKVNDVLLTEGTDYDIVPVDPYDPSTAGDKYLDIVFKGDYSGTLHKKFTVKAKKISSDDLHIDSIDDQTYTGSAIEAKPANVKDGTTSLEENKDYILSWENNINKGIATVKVTFINNYAATDPVSVNFKIVAKDISKDITVSISPTEVIYSGEKQTPTVTVKLNGNDLIEGQDYEVIFSDNENAGTGKATIRFINNYAATPDVVKTFTIKPATIQPGEITFGNTSDETFTGKPITTQKPDVYYKGNKLTPGTDFEYEYDNNIDVTNAAIVRAVFKGNYAGNSPEETTFKIVSKVVSDPSTGFEFDPTISPFEPQPYTGNPIEPHITITDPNTGYELEEGKDYTITYEDNTDVPGGKMIIEFKDNYEGTDPLTIPFEITPKDIKGKVEVTLSPSEMIYSGEQLKPTATVMLGTKQLIEGTDYTVDYGENKNAGKGTVIIHYIGNYLGTEDFVKEFTIKPATIDKDKLIIDDIPEHTFDDKPYEPHPDITYDGKPLKEGEDYILHYEDNTNVPKGRVIIEFINNYEGNDPIEKEFDIKPKDITGLTEVTLSPTEYTYDGTSHTPTVTVKVGDDELVHGYDYVVIYSNTVNAGTGTARVRFINNYAGSEDVVKTYTIKPAVIDPTKLDIEDIPPHTFDDQPYEPHPDITYDGKPLKENEDYILHYEDNTHTPGGKMIIEFINNYEDNPNIEVPFEITPKDIPEEDLSIVPDIENYPPQPYTGDPIQPKPQIKDGDKPLKEGEDYIIICDDTEIGPAEFIIQFINDYDGNDPIIVPFEIVPVDFDITIPDIEYTGDPALPKPIIKDGDKVLEEGVDYIVTCDDTESGTGTATIHFIGKYEGNPDIEKEFKIVPKESKDTKVTVNVEYAIQTGTEIEPEVIVKDGDKILEEGVDYIVLYTNNTNPGTAHANVVFIGNYKNTDPIIEDFIIKTDTLDNRASAKSSASVVLYYEDGFDNDITLVTVKKGNKESGLKDMSSLGGRFYVTYGGYDIKLYKGEKEIQPSEIEEGAIITLKIAIPDALKGVELKLVHVHSDEEISVIVPGEQAGIGTYIIDEEGYLVTQVNKFSDFSIIYESPCIAHWFLLAIALLDVILLSALIILNKKKTKVVGVIATTALIVISAVAGVFAHDLFCWIMLGINGGLVIANVIYFALVNRNNEEEKQPTTPQIIYVNAPAQAPVQAQEAPAPVVTAQEVPQEVKEEAPEEPKEEEVQADLSLKDSMAQAKDIYSDVVISKQSVATWLRVNYPGVVEVGDVKPGMTSTGLPLADTHYTMIGEQRKCFIYVYEVEGKCFFIVRGDEDTAKEIRKQGHKFINSAFPKTRDYAKWYTMLIDSSYANSEAVFSTLGYVIARLRGEVLAQTVVNEKPQPVIDDQKEDLSLKDSMAQAKDIYSDVVISKASVANWLRETYPDQVIVGDVKPGMTSTGLPLADTHYTFIEGNKKCFIYVYEVEGKVFFIVRGDDETANIIRGNGHKFMRSAFPKTRDYAKWYTILVDSSYRSSNEVFDTLKIVIARLRGEAVSIPAPAPVEEAKYEDLSLKDSMAQAKDLHSNVVINKASIANWLKENYEGKVIVGDVKPGMTSTGLPLADTHYTMIGEQKKCFAYVYEVEGKCFLIVRGNDDVAKAIRNIGHKFIPSAFPKTRDYAKWYTMLVDNSYKTSDELFDALRYVIDSLNGTASALKEAPEAIPEPAEELSLKDSMAQAKVAHSDVVINKHSIATWLRVNYPGVVEVGDVKPGMTSTGLPLADTHYTMIGEQRKCFAYVYEVDEKCFLIVRGDEEIAKAVRGQHHKFVSSAFPKTRDYAKWYTMLNDGSYATSDEFFNTLKYIIDALHGVHGALKPAQEVVVEQDSELSLKDAMAQAKEIIHSLSINKQVVADYLKENYPGKVIVNDVKPSMTSTGLPLGDTHYVLIDGNKKCFIYVYDVDGKCFFIVRSNDDVARSVRGDHHKFALSAFPKTRDYARWYTMLIDDSYSTNEEVFYELSKVIGNLIGEDPKKPAQINKVEAKPEPAPVNKPVAKEEAAKADLSLKDSINEAKIAFSAIEITKETIMKYLSTAHKDDVVVGTVKPSMTSTGLPLADTHYTMIGDQKKCFMYVYEIDGHCFMILRSDENTAREIQKKGHLFIQSSFPKTRDYAKWFTMLIDSSYESNNDVFSTIDQIIASYKK